MEAFRVPRAEITIASVTHRATLSPETRATRS